MFLIFAYHTILLKIEKIAEISRQMDNKLWQIYRKQCCSILEANEIELHLPT